MMPPLKSYFENMPRLPAIVVVSFCCFSAFASSASVGGGREDALQIVDFRFTPNVAIVCVRLKLICETSVPNATVWMSVDGSNVTRSASQQPLEILPYDDLGKKWMLDISCPQLKDSGVYTCHAMLSAMPETHVIRDLAVLVTSLAVLTVRLVTTPIILAKKNHSVELVCTVNIKENLSDRLSIDVHWSKDGVIILSKENITMVDSKTYKVIAVIPRVGLQQVGLYTCNAPMLMGNIISSTYVTIAETFVTSKPSITLVNSSSDANVTWSPPSLPVAISAIVNIEYQVIKTDSQKGFSNSGMESFSGNKEFYVWRNLSEGNFYKFQVVACLEGKQCGKPSESTVLTHFKSFASPDNVRVTCRYDNVSHSSVMDVSWNSPVSLNNTRLMYWIRVFGSSAFYDYSRGIKVDSEMRQYQSWSTVWRHLVKPNTNYSVQLCVVTTHGCGNLSVPTDDTRCSTPPSVPSELPLFRLRNGDSSDYLQLDLHGITERDGPIRCYRIVLYKLRVGQTSVPDSSSAVLHSYEYVHSEGGFGAYVAEAFDSENFKKIVILGDGTQTNCEITANSSETINVRHAVKRNVDSEGALNGFTEDLEDFPRADDDFDRTAYDGKLHPDTKYSGFVEVVVIGLQGKELKRRSQMFPVVKTNASAGLAVVALPTALGVICGLFGVILILTVALCVLRRKGMQPKSAGASFVPLPSTRPIRKDSLVSAYVARHKDSDLLFQREYEMLPEYFKDRTSKSSDSVDNFYKNRYPDIKAYDQTRVKLCVTGTSGSDYINANYVQGFRTQKKFICAQGPLDKTVNDFWKMIWQQRVEMIAMVTGLEENGKTKCVKYWPDEGDAKYDDLCVSTVSEVVCGEYAIRRFTVSTEAAGAVAPEQLDVVQYHYLAWKDFLAPDHPAGILKFIKRLREVISETGYEGYIVVHCSAGVGRTGTLVAIDSLLDQLAEEGQVDVFHFVATMRRYRNFLVQSLTQYIFIYRALAEYAQFGDTEVDVKKFAATLERLQSTNADGRPLIQLEFEKLDEVLEDYKTTDVGTLDVNVSKNRYDFIVPFDKNRVVLTALPSVSNSTYINASIIQGYDRSDAYIITQDPMELTISSFWRMVHEHCVPVIVMLSELGDEQDKCPKYWPDVEEDYDHVQVCLKDSEDENTSTIRKFLVTNKKTSSSHVVTHLQLKDWGVDLLVPASPKVILALIDRVHELYARDGSKDPVIVHCSGGSDRSAVFVALSILVRQVMAEGIVDVFHVVSNLRSQRKFMINNQKQYHFCYDALKEYIRDNGMVR